MGSVLRAVRKRKKSRRGIQADRAENRILRKPCRKNAIRPVKPGLRTVCTEAGQMVRSTGVVHSRKGYVSKRPGPRNSPSQMFGSRSGHRGQWLLGGNPGVCTS